MKILKNTSLLSSIFTLSCLLLFLSSIQASTWRVNNRPGIDADFSDLQAAIDAASNGDTLYIEGSPIRYSTGTLFITKPLTLIGPGIFLGENPTTQAYQEEAMVSTLDINVAVNPNSLNVILIGLHILHTTTIRNSNVIVKRCRISNKILMLETNDIVIEQCFLLNTSTSAASIDINNTSNVMVTNNFIHGRAKVLSVQNRDPVLTTVTVQNNILSGDISIEDVVLINNIHIAGAYTATNTLLSYNIGNSTQFGTNDGNQVNVDMSTVFEDVNGTIDNDFQLKVGSPAIGAGANGGDCGMFSADNGGKPYILSGMPPIPSIYEVTVPDAGFNTLNINVKSITHPNDDNPNFLQSSNRSSKNH